MMKWLRKNNKKLLAVVVVFLLMAWLGGQAIQHAFAPKPHLRTIGYAFDEKIRRIDQNAAYAQLQRLASLGVQVPADPLHWCLLVREARRAGIRVGEAEVKGHLAKIPGSAEAIAQLQKRRNVALATIYADIADYIRVYNMFGLAAAAVKVSEPEVMALVRNTTETVEIRFADVDAETLLDPDVRLDPAEVEAFYSTYRTVPAGSGELGYGYRWGPRIRVEYLSAEADRLAPHVRPPSDREIREYYHDHPDEFVEEVPTTTATAPATAAATTEPVRRRLTLTEARPAIIEALTHQRAAQEARSLITAAQGSLLRDWGAATARDNGFREAPANVRAAGYVERLADRFTLQRDLPVSYTRTGLLDRRAARQLEGIGEAYITDESTVGFAGAAFNVEGLVQPSRQDRKVLSLYEPSEILRSGPTDQPDRFYVFRVVEVAQPQPPTSLEEVRDRVESDLREFQAYQKARAIAAELLDEARRAGLHAAVETIRSSHEALEEALTVHSPQPLPRQMLNPYAGGLMPTYVPGIGMSERFIDRCFEMVKAQTTQPASSAPSAATATTTPSTPATQPARRFELVELPRQRKAVVVGLLAFHPLREDQYRDDRAFAQMILSQQLQRGFYQRWFSPEAIQLRAGWTTAEQAAPPEEE